MGSGDPGTYLRVSRHIQPLSNCRVSTTEPVQSRAEAAPVANDEHGMLMHQRGGTMNVPQP